MRKSVLQWLDGNPPLHELMERYPSEWELVGRELVSAMEDGRAETLNEFARRARGEWDLWRGRIRASRANPKTLDSALPVLIRSRMALLALDRCYWAASTGVATGKVRFGLLNGMIVQRLLFSRHLTRKPASLAWFRLCWPLITQRRILMPLVQPRGIYCFYSGKLIHELCNLIAGRSCLEIAAGDGTLSRFLGEAGHEVRATDDQSWTRAITYPSAVEKLDARRALQMYSPRAVLCSWPPPGNDFERHVFATRSVELYVVIGSRYRFASGNWDAYASQDAFEWAVEPRLSRHVLPPELDSAVLVFRRKV